MRLRDPRLFVRPDCPHPDREATVVHGLAEIMGTSACERYLDSFRRRQRKGAKETQVVARSRWVLSGPWFSPERTRGPYDLALAPARRSGGNGAGGRGDGRGGGWVAGIAVARPVACASVLGAAAEDVH